MELFIEVTFCRSIEDEPLIFVHDSSLSDLACDHTPQRLRAIAATLLNIANDAEEEYGSNLVRRRSYRVGTGAGVDKVN